MVNSLKDSQWSFGRYSRAHRLSWRGQPDLAGNGLSMAFPYMAPDNNNAFLADQVAPSFIANNNVNASKNSYGKWTPPSP